MPSADKNIWRTVAWLAAGVLIVGLVLIVLAFSAIHWAVGAFVGGLIASVIGGFGIAAAWDEMPRNSEEM